MPLTYESTHEYHFKDASMFFCQEHDCLRITEGYEDSILINGITEEKVDDFIKFYNKYVKKNENLENHNHSTDAAST